ncbi:MAG: GNAT family N-acetyltransferase [Chloroflexi bacterium]|nr:GNAT family N-acetyltransferase [Chloroflexota bacterium]
MEDEFRRQGIGTALLLKAREICKTRRLWTSTNESNLPMRGLLEAMG